MSCTIIFTLSLFSMAADSSGKCTNAAILTKIRPGAAWVMQGDSTTKLRWLDAKQKKPSSAEVEKARQACIAEAQERDARKAQARLDVKNPAIPVEKKVEQLILLLDLDK
jgi:hypothetical protein